MTLYFEVLEIIGEDIKNLVVQLDHKKEQNALSIKITNNQQKETVLEDISLDTFNFSDRPKILLVRYL